MRMRTAALTALSTLALTAASLAVGATGAVAEDGPDVTVDNTSNTATTFPGICASNQFSFVTVPVNLVGQSDSSSC
ncbi:MULTISPECIES: hypothetical protein [Streptomyces]|uniref:Chaplin n=1 Tax=Streptomyces rhizosphaericus TaxID=114699 RepID=A0A6G4A974_9ACTN|nr:MULTISPECIES: hypothetical protein [Streptomyces]MBA6436684.1 hypothetical protein [Streptomyces sp. GMR22]MBI0379678.1 hypothetical protein [Streptomyces albiflaviniger]NEW69758.1 hypothetical protein [Streptomyces rhizosphaericus]